MSEWAYAKPEQDNIFQKFDMFESPVSEVLNLPITGVNSYLSFAYLSTGGLQREDVRAEFCDKLPQLYEYYGPHILPKNQKLVKLTCPSGFKLTTARPMPEWANTCKDEQGRYKVSEVYFDYVNLKAYYVLDGDLRAFAGDDSAMLELNLPGAKRVFPQVGMVDGMPSIILSETARTPASQNDFSNMVQTAKRIVKSFDGKKDVFESHYYFSAMEDKEFTCFQQDYVTGENTPNPPFAQNPNLTTIEAGPQSVVFNTTKEIPLAWWGMAESRDIRVDEDMFKIGNEMPNFNWVFKKQPAAKPDLKAGQLEVVPTPVVHGDAAALWVNPTQSGNLTIDIVGENGGSVLHMENVAVSAGVQADIQINTANLQVGVYIISVKSDAGEFFGGKLNVVAN